MKATQEELDRQLLEGMPAAQRKQKRIIKKKFFSTKHVPLEVAVRRQVAEEIGEAEPTQGEKSTLLQKYGVKPAVIDRLVTKPKWMSESVWRRKLNEWFKMTHGLVRGYQEKHNGQKYQRHNGSKVRRPSGSVQNPNSKRNSGGNVAVPVQMRTPNFRARGNASFRKNT